MSTKEYKDRISDSSSVISQAEEEDSYSGFLIVGIGASAGGLAAFETFFLSFPDDVDLGMAFIVVQHLAPDHKSILADIIRNHTRMQVFEVEDGMHVKPNCIYIIPPNNDMAMLNGDLQLLEPGMPRGRRLPIDFFLRSLAQDQHDKAICIILSGTGSDGTLGARSIKGEGGMVMVQDPDTAEHDGMPRSAIATGMVDYVLSVSEMPKQLMDYSTNIVGRPLHAASVHIINDDNSLKKIFILLRANTRNDFSQYKPSTIYRRIERRMAIHQIETISSYVNFLQQSQEEVVGLFKDLLIGVTNFFRDPEAFRELEKRVIPKLFANKNEGSTIRVWSACCSTGEEAYSLAIMLYEYMTALKRNYTVQIFATDIDSQAIATARAGIYPYSIASDITPERFENFFTAESDGSAYRINKSIRDMLIFSEHNVINDPPFSKLDLISCRNLMIYLEKDVQKKLISLFHYALNPGGVLFLGTSENINESSDLFFPLDRKLRLFQRKNDFHGAKRLANGLFFPITLETPPTISKPAGNTASPLKLSLREVTEQSLLQQEDRAAVLVNCRGDILYFHGRTGVYLEPAQGASDINNILKMARDGLKRDLTTALYKADERKEIVHCYGIRVKTEDKYVLANLSIHPVAENLTVSYSKPLYLVILEKAIQGDEVVEIQSFTDGEQTLDTDAYINALKNQLRAKEEYFQATSEELKTANEELNSSKEEMQSINEELQSANEELETSREELQSINEELTTVNVELQTKMTELYRLNNDMNNMLAGTGIGTIFVDHNLHILRFTPSATDIINLIMTDIGRPVDHLVSNLANYDSLVVDLQTVLNTLVKKQVEVQTKKGMWYKMLIQPYRTLDNVIEGAVINFIDITEMKNAKEALVISEIHFRRLFETAKHGILILDAETGMIIDMNQFLIDMLGYSKKQLIQKAIWDIGFLKDVIANKEKFLELKQNEYVEYNNLPLETADGRKMDVEFISSVYLVNKNKVIQCDIREIG